MLNDLNFCLICEQCMSFGGCPLDIFKCPSVLPL